MLMSLYISLETFGIHFLTSRSRIAYLDNCICMHRTSKLLILLKFDPHYSPSPNGYRETINVKCTNRGLFRHIDITL